MTVGRFRAGVAAVVWSPERRRYLLLQRAADKDFAAGAWECVTGRVDQGEGFEDALRREVWEELGIRVEPDFIIGTTHFYRGALQPENELVGVIYHCSVTDRVSVMLSGEHQAHRWVTSDEARDLLREDHASEVWLRRVLDRAEAVREQLPDSLIESNRSLGFEMG
jgi:8-oxo-dGTP pyrophosphatase MutT (NUDIX family)